MSECVVTDCMYGNKNYVFGNMKFDIKSIVIVEIVKNADNVAIKFYFFLTFGKMKNVDIFQHIYYVSINCTNVFFLKQSQWFTY